MRRSQVVFLLMIGILFSPLTWCAEKPGSAQQALDQLHMLQKKLGTKEGTAETASADASKKAAKPLSRKERAQSRSSRTKKNSSAMTADDSALINDLAFDSVKQQLFPLSSEQTLKLKKWYHDAEYAEASSPETPPKPTATSQFVNLSPGSTPPVIRLSQGFVSSLVFLDSTGAPWPITAYDLGDPNAFNIQWDKISNTLMIQSNKLYTYGNLAVRLHGLNTPVMLTLIPGQKAVDYRVDLRVQGYGPNAKQMPMGANIPPSASDVLLHVLDGVPPAGSTRLTVSGGDAQAWILSNRMFIRTNLTILSPGWIGSMTSADGTHAYEMHKSPVLLVSWHGKVMQLKVEGL
ncbi:MAG: DotH/IcmK family type IV secretion protein [Gammaproteobacteria bacterium]|nr:DotH/IcmK family type IV secretion protein [Gammaproteobacteria bacterium]MCH9763436.1 DotH/IcmK family type IV secretion protein [Gammaproteobacteria bacterium]